MNKKIILLVLLIFLVAGCSESDKSLDSNQVVINNDDYEPYQGQFTTLRFEKPFTIEQLDKLSRVKGLKIEEFRIDFGGFTSGYTVAGKQVSDIIDDFNYEHQKFIQVVRENSGTDEEKELSKILVDIANSSLQDLNITAVSFRASPEELPEIGYGSIVDSGLVVLPLDRPLEDEEIDSKDTKDPATTSSRHESWAAYTGWSAVTQSYSYQTFKFDNLIAYIDISTYEHETQIYDKNFADYAGYWASNLPCPYKDTPFLDNIDNFTVGSAYADALVANYNYWTYMSLRPQSSKTALCKIRGQIGYRFPSWCYSTWCIYALATTTPGCYAYLALPDYGVTWQY